MSAAHGSGIGRDRRFELFGHAEIQQLHMTRLADHHIGGLDVSVNDSGVVGGFECRCDLLAVRKHIVNRQVTGPNLLFKRSPWHELHHDEVGPGGGVHFVHGDNVRMTES